MYVRGRGEDGREEGGEGNGGGGVYDVVLAIMMYV